MHREKVECSEILEVTTKALNNDTLKWLLAIVQEVNLKFRIKVMLQRYGLSGDNFKFG